MTDMVERIEDIDWKAWALDLCSLLDEIESVVLLDDVEVQILLKKRFEIARKHGMTVEIIGAGEVGHA